MNMKYSKDRIVIIMMTTAQNDRYQVIKINKKKKDVWYLNLMLAALTRKAVR